MMPPVLAAHFERLKARYQGALLSFYETGAAMITIPACPLPAGWSSPAVTLRFIAPNGYPVSAPDCFWVEPNLAVNGSNLPRNSQINNQIPDAGITAHWFSWHLDQGQWWPNEHDLMTWLNLCLKRLQTPV
jgi:hypothetical protein